MANLNKLSKVNDSFIINRYDNGWMVEVNGKDSNGDWKTCKILCQSEKELLELVSEYNAMDLE